LQVTAREAMPFSCLVLMTMTHLLRLRERDPALGTEYDNLAEYPNFVKIYALWIWS